jgi:3-phenylpropionate/cinnamic acid dioxygenase small subunit
VTASAGECLHCAIGAVNTRFGRALDERDIDGFVVLFTPDATYDNGRTVLAGHAALREWAQARALAPVRTTRHVWSALSVEAVDDHELRAASTWITYAANQAPPVDFVAVSLVADFADVFRLVDGAWLIHHRSIRPVFRDPSVGPHV